MKRCGWENLISIFLMNNLKLDTISYDRQNMYEEKINKNKIHMSV